MQPTDEAIAKAKEVLAHDEALKLCIKARVCPKCSAEGISVSEKHFDSDETEVTVTCNCGFNYFYTYW